MDITFEKVGFTYQPSSPLAFRALHDIQLTIKEGSYTAIIGHTGSGKSTLLQHLNALVKPTTGKVVIGEREILPETDNKNLKPIRKQVGIVFQFPEAQLFEETVAKDIAFGPKNFGATEEEGRKLAEEMLEVVGLGSEYLDRSPFELSGGQMRRVAIAGVLAMKPEVLVLDEPTAGLDPRGRKEMMALFLRLHREQKMTIVLVTHLMDDVAEYADYVCVLEQGTLVKQGSPADVFADVNWLKERQLGVPAVTAFAQKLVQRGFQFERLPIVTKDLAALLKKQLPDGEVREMADE